MALAGSLAPNQPMRRKLNRKGVRPDYASDIPRQPGMGRNAAGDGMNNSAKKLRPAPHGAALCNEAIEGFDDRAAKAAMIAEASQKLEELFDVLRIDHINDRNTRDTPRRVARMFVEEVLRGRYDAAPKIPNSKTAYYNPDKANDHR